MLINNTIIILGNLYGESCKTGINRVALRVLRDLSHFSWIVIPLLALVLYAYFDAIEKKKYKQVAGGLALYMVYWFF